MSVRELTYGEAVREAVAEEMRRDPRVLLIGEDVAETGHPFRMLSGLVQEFGTKRVVDLMFNDFIPLTIDRIINQAAEAHHLSGGELKMPIIFRTTLGAARGSAGPVRFSPVLEDLTVPSAKMVFEAAKALSRRLTEAIERRKIAWFERRIALAGCRRSALTGDEP